jgi:hypothetical protein
MQYHYYVWLTKYQNMFYLFVALSAMHWQDI